MDLFTLAAKLSLDSSEFEKGISKAENQGSSLASKLGGGIARAGKFAAASVAAGVSAATAAITTLTKSAVEAYGEYEQLVGGAKLVYGDAYDVVEARAKEAYSNVQMSASDYLQQVNGLAVGLKEAMGGDAKAAADLADKVVTAEADVVAAMGISQEAAQNAFNGIMRGNYMMLDNLQIGIKGSQEGMQDVIDKVNKWNKENGKATKYNIKNIADQQAALVDYIEMVGLAGYAQNEGLTTLQGSISATKAAWENFKVAIADPNGNVGDAIKAMVNSAKGAFHNLVPIVRQTISGIAGAVKELAPIIGRELPAIIGELAPQVWEIFTGFVSGVWEGLTSVLGEVKWPTWDEVKTAAGAAWETIKNGALGLAGLVFGKKEDGSVAWPTWDDVKAVAATAWNAIKAGAASIANTLGGLVFGKKEDGTVAWPEWTTVYDAASAAWESIKAGALSIADTLGGLVFGRAEDGTVAWPDPNKLLEDFSTWWDETARPALEGAMSWTLQLFGVPKESADQIASVIGGWWDTVVGTAQSVLSWALNLPGAPYDAGTQLHDIIQGWWDGVKAAAQGLLSWVLGIPDMEDANGVSMKQKISDWWKTKVKPALKGILNFTLGLFGLPSVSEMKAAIEKRWAEIKAAVGNLVINVVPRLLGFGGEPTNKNTASDPMGVMNGGELPDLSQFGPFGHHAKGSPYIPYDNYPALLHRGEQVLTASQARQRNDNNVDLSALIPAIVGAVREGMQDVTVRSYLSSRDITDDVSKNTMRAIRARRFAT